MPVVKVYSLSKKTRKPLVYKPNFMDLLAAAQNDVQEARDRVKIDPVTKQYSYEPSEAYKRFLHKITQRLLCLLKKQQKRKQ